MSSKERMARVRSTPAYWTQRLYLSLNKQLIQAMEELGVSKSELADRIEASPSWISRLFHNEANVTLKTIARLSLAVGLRPILNLIHEDEEVVVRKREDVVAVTLEGIPGLISTSLELGGALSSTDKAGTPADFIAVNAATLRSFSERQA